MSLARLVVTAVRVEGRAKSQVARDYRVSRLAIGMEAFAERARRELVATGEKVRKRTVETHDALSAQEALIARLAREGLSNPGDRRPVVHQCPHGQLPPGQDVHPKLDISSRAQLDRVLPGDPATARPR